MIRLLSLMLALLVLPVSAFAAETLTIDTSITHQTIESFGTSGAWWSQYVGLWDDKYLNTQTTNRQRIATLLYHPTYGIGLTGYRYNLGAGSADSGLGNYWDEFRRAQSFEVAPGEYDFSKDAGAQWFLQEAVRLGATEVTLFFNSPLERLTISGTAQVSKGANKNIEPENYAEWAKYACDVTEYFISQGVPVRFISPINEPQWAWDDGQEGCHYEPRQIAGVYIAFLEEMRKRPALSGVELSGPESGEWGGQTVQYVSAILGNKVLGEHFKAIDCHSYWSDTQAKVSFKNWMTVQYPNVKIRMSEWCEMVNGTDLTMDSAIHLAQCVQEDLTVLDAVSWCTWVGVSPGGYRDGLIHATENGAGEKSIVPLKRLWAYGNYTRYIRPGFTRVETTGARSVYPVAFTGERDGKQQLVIVLINEGYASQFVNLAGDFSAYTKMDVHETSTARDLARTYSGAVKTEITLPMQSVITIVMTK